MAERDKRIFHGDLCFGCGQANLFGLQLEVEPVPGGVEGRFFVKQDHQGRTGQAHAGVVATALEETMALLAHHEGLDVATTGVELELLEPAPVGTFVRLRGRLGERHGDRLRLAADARDDGGTLLARAEATVRVDN